MGYFLNNNIKSFVLCFIFICGVIFLYAQDHDKQSLAEAIASSGQPPGATDGNFSKEAYASKTIAEANSYYCRQDSDCIGSDSCLFRGQCISLKEANSMQEDCLGICRKPVPACVCENNSCVAVNKRQ